MVTLAILACGLVAFLTLCEAGFDVLILGVLGVCAAIAFIVFCGAYCVKTLAVFVFVCALPCAIYWAVKRNWKRARGYLLCWVIGTLVVFVAEWIHYLK